MLNFFIPPAYALPPAEAAAKTQCTIIRHLNQQGVSMRPGSYGAVLYRTRLGVDARTYRGAWAYMTTRTARPECRGVW